MNEKQQKPKTHSLLEKVLAPFAFIAGAPTNASNVPFSTSAPSGLTLVCSAPTMPEADLTRQILRDAGFHVGFVPTAMTGAFGISGSIDVYVQAGEEEEATEFLRQLWDSSAEDLDKQVDG